MRPPPAAKARNIRDAISHEIGADIVCLVYALCLRNRVAKQADYISLTERCHADLETWIWKGRFRNCADSFRSKMLRLRELVLRDCTRERLWGVAT